jgi:UDP-GlcNAc3NAcA epimerase
MSMPIHCLTVVGARPQFIKAATVSRAIGERDDIRETMVHTGQHYDANMSEVFFEEMAIPRPAINLEIGSDGHGKQTGAMLAALDQVIVERRPDCVLVYGDTNSTLAGALAAAKLHVPVVHVEAGLRSFNRAMPEEINRVVTDHIADLLFAPSTVAVRNLANEGIPSDSVVVSGDVMYDAVLFYRERIASHLGLLERLGVEPGGYLLATIHRAENTDHPARIHAIAEAFGQLAAFKPIVLPLHPRTRKMLFNQDVALDTGGVHVIEPVGYLDMLILQIHAAAVITDSGGMQKEAFFNGVPCVTVREETEWLELVELGWNRLAPPTSPDSIVAAVHAALGSMGRPGMPYGDGDAARDIVAEMVRRYAPGRGTS